MLKKWLGMALITPMLTFIIWVFNSHTIITYLNILFYVSLIIFISIFLILLVQEGIFDATSYGFRRLKYQMSSSKRRSLSLMIIFQPTRGKKRALLCSTWIMPLLLINILYFIMTIVLSLILV
ncbi:membrane protein [Staphylococcus aureus]|uniref:Membrane protein n=1 Tax=Staphylococcus aureus TaxID=1280 RepID=A0A380E210_STAAU|nr:membrane protein [Staphylococcus aureus]